MRLVLSLSILALIAIVLVIYYIIKLVKREMDWYSFSFLMVLTISCATMWLYRPIKEEYVRARVTANSKYSISYVIEYSKYLGPGVSSRWAKMYLELNGEKKVIESSIILNNDYDSGEINKRHFLAVYDSIDTEYCVLLFDYPINDSTDYYKYLEQLEKEPLDLRKSPWLSSLLYKEDEE